MISGLKGETYEEKLKELGIQTLEDRRTRYDLIQTFKIISRTEDVEPSTWFKMVDVSRQRQTRSAVHHLNIQPERTNLEIRKHFYSNRVVEKWNNLPTNVKEAPNVNTFKSTLLTEVQWSFNTSKQVKYQPPCAPSSYASLARPISSRHSHTARIRNLRKQNKLSRARP